MRTIVFAFLWLFAFVSNAQNRTMTPTELALQKLLAEGGVMNGSVAVMAYNLDNGRVIVDYNAQKSMIPASVQKLFTTATALQVLGPNFTYKTILATDGSVVDGVLKGNLYVVGSGDPTLQSRYHETDPPTLTQIKISLSKFKSIDGKMIIDASHYNQYNTPRGWIWEDLGNYFGAPPTAVMWKDNLLEVDLRSGQTGTRAMLASNPDPDFKFDIQVMASNEPGDNAWFFSAPGSDVIYAKGTIPAHQTKFTVKAAHPKPEGQFVQDIYKTCGLGDPSFQIDRDFIPHSFTQTLGTIMSPKLDLMVKICNTRSINQYAEAFATELDTAKHFKSIEGGVVAIEQYLKSQKVNTKGIRLTDGSGLSPLNRITCQSMVDVLGMMYRSQNKDAFMASLPVAGENGTLSGTFKVSPIQGNLRAKSGTMTGVRNYAGYMKNKNGETIAVCVMLNDYDENRKAQIMTRLEELLSAVYSD